MAGLSFDLFSQKDNIKNKIKEIRKNFLDMFSDVREDAKKTGHTVDSVINGLADQRKWRKAMDGDAFSKAIADRMGAQRKMIQDAMKVGMLSRNDLTSRTGRNRLANDLHSGSFARELNLFKKSLSDNGKASGRHVNVLKSLENAYSSLSKKIEATHKKTHELHESLEKFTKGGFVGRYSSYTARRLTYALGGIFSIWGIKRLGNSILGAATEREMDSFRLRVPFGNRGNAAAAMELAEKMGTTGKTPFKSSDMVDAFKQMMEMGIDPRNRKNFNTFGNIAGATGQSMSAVSSDISSAVYGNSSILRKYGVNNQQIFALDRMVNQRPDARKNVIMQILSGDKRYKNGMKEFSYSWQGMVNQIKNHWEAFKLSIIGDPKDKNSLYSKLKDTFQKVIDWLNRNQARIKRFGIAVGEVLKWVLRQVTAFMKWVAHGAESILKKVDGSSESFRDKMAKMVLWLELTKEKVVRFLDKWGWAIKLFVKIWVGAKIASLILSPFTKLLGLLGGGSGGGGIMGALFNLIPKIGVFATRLGVALGPIGLVLAGLAALVAYVGVGNGNGTLKKYAIGDNSSSRDNTGHAMNRPIQVRGGNMSDADLNSAIKKFTGGKGGLNPSEFKQSGPKSDSNVTGNIQLQELIKAQHQNTLKGTIYDPNNLPKGAYPTQQEAGIIIQQMDVHTNNVNDLWKQMNELKNRSGNNR